MQRCNVADELDLGLLLGVHSLFEILFDDELVLALLADLVSKGIQVALKYVNDTTTSFHVLYLYTRLFLLQPKRLQWS